MGEHLCGTTTAGEGLEPSGHMAERSRQFQALCHKAATEKPVSASWVWVWS